MDNFDYLTEVFYDYCIKHKLPIDISADDMIYYFYNNDDSFKKNPYNLTDKNVEWLRRFIVIWGEIA